MTATPGDRGHRADGPVVTLIVGSTGRPRASARGSRGAEVAGAAQQWSCSWSATGPGPVWPSSPDDADLTLTLSPADADLARQGLLAPSVAFMQGRLKTAGDNALLLRVLAWAEEQDLAAVVAAWAGGQSDGR